jgi:cephalosporin hydroxylase
MKNKIISKKNFIDKNKKTSQRLFTKKKYFKLYKIFLEQTLSKRIAHQTVWFGEPILQLPQDLIIHQELIYNYKPDFFIEVGVAWSGSLLFYSTIFNIVGGKKVIGIEKYLLNNVFKTIKKFPKLEKKITVIKGHSTHNQVINKIKNIIGKSKKIIVHLDSDHSEKNVLKELEIYSKLIGKGSYIICGDTHVEFFKKNPHGKNKNYFIKNNPMTALRKFLKTTNGKKFKQDLSFQNRYLLTLNPFGILKKIKN